MKVKIIKFKSEFNLDGMCSLLNNLSFILSLLR